MTRLNYKRKIRAFINRNKKNWRDYILAFILGVIIAISGFYTYIDYVKRGLI